MIFIDRKLLESLIENSECLTGVDSAAWDQHLIKEQVKQARYLLAGNPKTVSFHRVCVTGERETIRLKMGEETGGILCPHEWCEFANENGMSRYEISTYYIS